MAKSRSPFLDNSLLQQEIDDFLTRFRATFAQQVQRTSAFFEIACYNDLVRYYEAMHFEVTPHNTMPRSKQFVYALSTNAKPENWAAAGFTDTLLRWKMKPEVVHGEKKDIQPRVQARGGQAGH